MKRPNKPEKSAAAVAANIEDEFKETPKTAPENKKILN